MSVTSSDTQPGQGPPPPPTPAPALTHLTTNLHLLRFPHASTLASLSLTTSANPRATDAILAFLFQHIDPHRARSTFRPLLALTATDPGARRSFRAAAHAWLDELKHMFPGPVLLRKSVLDDGRGDRFVEVLACLSFHAVRCVLARVDVGRANAVAEVAGPLGRLPGGDMERRAVEVVDEYRDVLMRDVAVRRSCAALAAAYDKRLTELDDEWAQVAQHLAPVDAGVPSTSAIRDQLVAAHQELGDQWARLSSAVPWEPARDLVRSALDPHHKRAELPLAAPESNTGPPGAAAPVDWTHVATAAARTLTDCAHATASTPVDATSIAARAAHVARMADEAEDRCKELQAQVDAASARVEALRPAVLSPSPSVECDGGEFPIRLREYPQLEIRPHASPEVVAKAVSTSWAHQELVVPPSSMSHPPPAYHHHPPCVAAPPPHVHPSRKRPASTAHLDAENMHPPATKPPRPRHLMGPPSTLPAHGANRPAVPFTPQSAHRASSVTLVSTPTSASSSFHRPPAIWTMSPIRAPRGPIDSPPFPASVDVPCGASRRVSFTFRPLTDAPDMQRPSPALPAAVPRSSRRSTDVHRMIVDQMLDDAHAPPLSPAARASYSSAGAAPAADVSWTTPGRPSDCFALSSFSSVGHRLSGPALALRWFAGPASPCKHRASAKGMAAVDADVSFDLDAFVSEEEGKGGVTAIGDEQLPRVSNGGAGGSGRGEDEGGEVGDDSLLMMLES